MNLRRRILAGHLLLTALLGAIAIFGIYRLRDARIGREQGVASGLDLSSVNLLTLQVDEYFRLQRLGTETRDGEFLNAAHKIREAAKPVYSNLRKRLEDPEVSPVVRHEKLDELFGWSPSGSATLTKRSTDSRQSPPATPGSGAGIAAAPGLAPQARQDHGSSGASNANPAEPRTASGKLVTGEMERRIDKWDRGAQADAQAEMDAMYEHLKQRLSEETEAAHRYAKKADRAVLVVLLISAPLAVGWSFLVIRSIRRGLDRLMEATEKVGRGRFDIHLPVTGKDELSRLSRAFNEMSTELAKARKREADFLAVASHELRTPLACIQAYSQKVRSSLPDRQGARDATEYLDRIGEEIDHLVSKTSDLLALGVIEAGQLKLEVRQFLIRGFLLTAAAAVRPIAAQREVELEVDIHPLVPATYTGDPDRLKQVLLNLLDNAFKFTPRGGSVGLRAGVLDGHLQIEVSDTGPGIPSEKLESIFEKYSQARSSPDESRAGTGLGLAVARGIVNAHGGTIKAQSTPGQGSRLIVCLPLAAQAVRGKEVA